MMKPYLPGRPPTYAMCFEPTTLAMVAIGTAVASSAVGAVGAIQSGQAAKSQANYQATVMQQQAEQERQAAAAKEMDFRAQQSRALASRRAAMGGSGTDPTQGSSLLVDEDFAGEAELQALRIRNGGDIAATRAEQSAALQRSSGANAVTNSYYRAGSSLLGGAGNAFGYSSRLKGGGDLSGGGLKSSNAFGPDAYG